MCTLFLEWVSVQNLLDTIISHPSWMKANVLQSPFFSQSTVDTYHTDLQRLSCFISNSLQIGWGGGSILKKTKKKRKEGAGQDAGRAAGGLHSDHW